MFPFVPLKTSGSLWFLMLSVEEEKLTLRRDAIINAYLDSNKTYVTVPHKYI